MFIIIIIGRLNNNNDNKFFYFALNFLVLKINFILFFFIKSKSNLKVTKTRRGLGAGGDDTLSTRNEEGKKQIEN